MMLTEQSIDKLAILQGQLGFDGRPWAPKSPRYDPARGCLLPHQVK